MHHGILKTHSLFIDFQGKESFKQKKIDQFYKIYWEVKNEKYWKVLLDFVIGSFLANSWRMVKLRTDDKRLAAAGLGVNENEK